MKGIIEFYDKDGTPLTLQQWVTLSTHEYKRIAQTTLLDGTFISTIWLGLDHGFDDGPPLIFETMVFPTKDNMSEHDVERYATLAEAEAGHKAMVEKWKHGKPTDSL